MKMKMNVTFSLIMALVLLLILTNGCKKNDTGSTAPIHTAVGQSFQGGIVAYIKQPGDAGYDSASQHGLIAAAADQSAGMKWMTAMACADTLRLGGYTDWAVPTFGELTQLRTNQAVIGGFTPHKYWSTELSNMTTTTVGAHALNFADGAEWICDTVNQYAVRSVRRF